LVVMVTFGGCDCVECMLEQCLASLEFMLHFRVRVWWR
jgi:hypothetical protein